MGFLRQRQRLRDWVGHLHGLRRHRRDRLRLRRLRFDRHGHSDSDWRWCGFRYGMGFNDNGGRDGHRRHYGFRLLRANR